MAYVHDYPTEVLDYIAYRDRREMIYNRAIGCDLHENGFPSESGSSEGFFLMPFQGDFARHHCLWLARVGLTGL